MEIFGFFVYITKKKGLSHLFKIVPFEMFYTIILHPSFAQSCVGNFYNAI